jgi:AAA domain
MSRPVPELLAELAELLDDGKPGKDAATDAAVAAFLAAHTGESRPELLRGRVAQFGSKAAAGESRHSAMVPIVTGAMEETRAGYYPAATAVAELRAVFVAAVTKPPRARTDTQARAEFAGILAWAVAQAQAADLDTVRAGVAERMPRDDLEGLLPLVHPRLRDTMRETAMTQQNTPTDGNLAEVIDLKSRDAVKQAAGRRVHLTRAADVRDDTPTWAWTYNGAGRIQLATLCLFAGRPASGKSTAARWFAAGYSVGTIPGCWEGNPQNVAYVATEESIEYMVKPSLRAAGADMSRVHFVTVTVDGNDGRLSAIADETALITELQAAGVTVTIVDPLMSTVSGSADIHKNNETRERLLDPWQRIAQKTGIVLGIAHLRKDTGADPLAAITGSSAFGEVARSVFGFAKDPESDDGHRVLTQAKNSAGREDLSLIYRLESHNVTTDSGKSGEVPRFVIIGDADKRVEDILVPAPGGKLGKGAAAEEWLRGFLARGPEESATVKAHAECDEHSRRTIERAASKLGFTGHRGGYQGSTQWARPENRDTPRFGATEKKGA